MVHAYGMIPCAKWIDSVLVALVLAIGGIISFTQLAFCLYVDTGRMIISAQ